MTGALIGLTLLSGTLIPQQDPVVIEAKALAEQECGSGINEGMASIVATYFPESELCTALRIVACESGGNPDARNGSGASGLFQVMPFWADHYGYSRHSLFDPMLNTEIAYRIWSEEGGWKHWSCY